MANRNGSAKYRVDRRATTVLVPIGAVLAVLAFLMLARSGHEDASPPPDNVGSKTTSSKVER